MLSLIDNVILPILPFLMLILVFKMIGDETNKKEK